MLAAVLLEYCVSRMKPVGCCPVFCDWLGVSSSCRERELVRRVEKDWDSLLPSHKSTGPEMGTMYQEPGRMRMPMHAPQYQAMQPSEGLMVGRSPV